jgi:hypothetical protein
MSKFLLNLLLQISKICQKFKFQTKFERILFLELWPISNFWPSRGYLPSSPTGSLSPSPLGLSFPVDPARPASPLTAAQAPPDFLLPQDKADRVPPPACAAPRRSPPPSASKIAEALTPHHFPPPGRSPPEMAHNGAPLHRRLPSLVGRHRSSPRPYKRHLSTPPPSHRPDVLPLSFPPLLSSTVITAVAEPDAAGETPLHRLPTCGDPTVELAGPSFPSPAPWLELSGTGAAGARAPVCSYAQQCPPVQGGLVAPRSIALWTESTDFPSKNNSKKSNFLTFLGKFAEKPLEVQTFITF